MALNRILFIPPQKSQASKQKAMINKKRILKCKEEDGTYKLKNGLE